MITGILPRRRLEMEGWHVYDRHDKAVPYDVFIKRAKGQKKKKDAVMIKSRMCLVRAALNTF